VPYRTLPKLRAFAALVLALGACAALAAQPVPAQPAAAQPAAAQPAAARGGAAAAPGAAAVAAPGASAAASRLAAYVDLGALDLYVRPGFSIEWTYYEPAPEDPAWTRVPANREGRPLVLRDLRLPGEPEPRPSLLPGKARKFCVIATFWAGPELIDSSSGIGLYLEDIGKNWEVFLNGSSIRSEIFLGRDGRISRERAVHGALVSIDRRYLKPGKNILAFEILGDATDVRTGLFSPGPYVIGDYEGLLSRKAEYLDLMLIGIYFFFALYHLILFALRPQGRLYLLHGLGTLFFALYLFARSYIVFDVLPDTAFIRGLELSSLFLLFAFYLLFFDVSNRGRVSPFAWAYSGASALAALAAPFAAGELVLKGWQLSLPAAIAYLLAFDAAIPAARVLRGAAPGGEAARGGDAAPAAERADGGASRRAMAVGSARVGGLARDAAGRGRPTLGLRLKALRSSDGFWTIVIAAAIALTALAAAFFDLNSRAAFVAAKVGAFLMVMGTAAVLAERFNRVHREVESLNAGLEAKVGERTAALARAMEEQSGLNAKLVAANRRLESAMEAEARDMRIAVQVQQGFFPQRPPRLEDWDLAFAAQPARGVSGDLYDFYVEGGRLRGLVVGDVSGHGISSGLVTVMARSILYRNIGAGPRGSLGLAFEDVHAELAKELASVENYLTAAALRFEGSSVEYANAAHPDLAFRRAGKARASFLAPPSGDWKGPPLGREGIEAPYNSLKFEVAPGDALLAYTDCLLEARDVDGKPFGPEGILSAFGRAPDGTAAEMLEYILEEFRFHARGVPLADDLTLVVVKRR